MQHKIAGWFRRNNLLMAQLHDLKRQLQEAWEESDKLGDHLVDSWDAQEYLREQFDRLDRERYEERGKRIQMEEHYEEQLTELRNKLIEAENRLIDRYLENVANEEE